MKVVIFGATGTIGQQLLQQALNKDYKVTAFCRNRQDLGKFQHKSLAIIEGDVFLPESVLSAVQNQDVVLNVIGSASRKSVVRSEGTKNIIAAMQKSGVKRLICQSTLGTGESNRNLNFFWKHVMFGWFLKQVFLDHELQEEYVRNSGLDWTIIRPSSFTNGKKTEQYKHGFAPTDRSLTLKISREDVADFILKQIHSNQYLFRSPGLSY